MVELFAWQILFRLDLHLHAYSQQNSKARNMFQEVITAGKPILKAWNASARVDASPRLERPFSMCVITMTSQHKNSPTFGLILLASYQNFLLCRHPQRSSNVVC